ncbi:hypothetical protein B0H16DRAFT_1894567 [Mycena metata]|uniref:Uncharacterized protein n=1 Tax=Mycena metata TaxID=1033252 RepID=A0AAD7HS61_9AGAR|nr:hypothetical protein B0H16DRAFT_1894567 [Mycena metata]
MPYPAHHSINPSHSLSIASSLAFASSSAARISACAASSRSISSALGSTSNPSSSSEDRCGRTPTTSSSPSTPTAVSSRQTKHTRNRTRRGTRFCRPGLRPRRTTQPAHLRLVSRQLRLRLPHRCARGLDHMPQRRAAPALAWSCGLFGSKQEGEELVPLAPVSRPAVGDNEGCGPMCLGVG